MAFQAETDHHLQRPPIDQVEASVLAICTPYSRCGLPQNVLAALSTLGNSTAPSPASSPASKAASSG
jgi:hypothetical protein